jgi:hypothetical protein
VALHHYHSCCFLIFCYCAGDFFIVSLDFCSNDFLGAKIMKKVKVISAQLQSLLSEFEVWRSNRVGNEAIPQLLWDKAISLVQSHSLLEVSHHLRINYNQLKDKYMACLPKDPSSTAFSSTQTEFLEINPQSFTPLLSHTSPLSQGSFSLHNHNHNQNQNQNQNQSQNQNQNQNQDKNKDLNCQIVFERCDGSKLSVSLPVDSTVISNLCTSLLRA